MPIPTASNYPEELDSNDNLYLVHDALRVRLAEDYEPGDTSISIQGDEEVIAKFPPTGLITLTEQCSHIDERAISFYYGSRTESTFDDLILLTEFTDVSKPKIITNVTQNVMAQHHNALKDALIAVQTFVGVDGTTDTAPLGETLEGRLNFLKKLILTPKAWFTMDQRIGLVPLCVTFTDQSFRLGDGEVIYIWNFGDGSTQTISTCVSTISGISCSFSVISMTPSVTISTISAVPDNASNVLVRDLDGGSIRKCYQEPGLYDVTLSVINQYGVDVVKFDRIINARIEAPDLAIVNYVPRSSQNVTGGTPIGGPYTTTPPKIRSVANTFIDLEIPDGVNPSTGRTYAGELVDSFDFPIDPIIEYTWSLGDDLDHSNLKTTRASYSVGGLYDMELRVDTRFGAYRITQYDEAIDIVESQNLWLFNFATQTSVDGGTVRAYEFGLLSETFKILGNQTLTVNRSNEFLDYLSDTDVYHSSAEERAKNEFSRNVFFTKQGTVTSGNAGNSLLFYASGGSVIAAQSILVNEYNGFNDTYASAASITNRPWNWFAFSSEEDVYIMLGSGEGDTPLDSNLAKAEKVQFDISMLTYFVTMIDSSNFTNGADELLDMPSAYVDGIPTNGYFASYRTAWMGNTGYLLRNSAVNEFYRLADFYQTEGTLVQPFVTMTKLPDVAGSAKLEGQLVPMYNGVFLFGNTGEIAAWNTTSSNWEVGRVNSASVSFRSLQDAEVSGFDSRSNTLLAASDGDRAAYLSYDYSTNVFIKYNGTDQTFTSAGARPSGTQFAMSIY